MIRVASAAVWVALLLAAWNAGHLGARWRDDRGAPPASGWLFFAAGAALALAWSALAGTVLRGASPLALSAESLPVPVAAGYRLATLWATARGAPLTAALAFSVAATLAVANADQARAAFARRLASALSMAAAVALAGGLLVAPPFAISSGRPAAYPVFLVHPGAALAPLCALAAVVAVVVAACAAAARTGAAGFAVVAARVVAPALQLAWIAATLELLAEQAARGAIGLTRRDGLIAGGASAGLWLWLLVGVLLHPRVRALVFGAVPPRRAPAPALRGGALAAHAGAVLVALAFALHIAGRRAELTLPPGMATEMNDVFGRPWRFVSQGVSRFDAGGHDVTALAVEVTGPSGASALLTTEQRQYYEVAGSALERPVAVRGVRRGLAQDLRIVLDSVGTGEAAAVSVAFVPLTFLWLPGAALVLITAIAGLIGARPPMEEQATAQ